MGYYNGKHTQLIYVTNHDKYTDRLSGAGSVTITVSEESEILIKITQDGEVVPGAVILVSDKEYISDKDGKIEAIINGNTTILSQDGYYIEVEVDRSILEKFTEIDTDIQEIESDSKALSDNLGKLKQQTANSLTTIITGTSEVIINDVSPIEHEMFIKLKEVIPNEIPLMPYEINQDHIGGIPYKIEEDGTIHISGICDGRDGYGKAVTVKEITLLAGTYTFECSGANDSLSINCTTGKGWFGGIFTIAEESVVQIQALPTVKPGESYDVRLKPFLYEGAYTPGISNVKVEVCDENGYNKKIYRTDANGYVAVKSLYPTTIVRANEGLKLEVEYNKDLDSILRGHKEHIDELSKTAQENQASTEQHFEELGENVGNIGDRANKNEESIEKLQKKINQNTEAVEKLDAGYSGMRKDIGSNTEKINSLDARQKATDGELLNINGKINSLPSKVYVDNSVSEKERALREAINEKANSKDVNKALEEKAKGVNGIAEKAIADTNGNDISKTYATKEEVGKTKGEIEILSEEVKSEIRAVGEQVKNSIPNDYSELSAKINNTSNALRGEASGEIVSIKDVSPVEHKMDVEVSSKNLCDNVFEVGGINSENGENIDTASVRSVNYHQIKPNTTYTIKAHNFTTNIRFRFYDKEKKYIENVFNAVANGDEFTFTTTNNSYFVRFDIVGTDTNILLMLEEGTVATDYTPYVADVSAAKVKKYGLNLLSYPYYEKNVTRNGITYTVNEDRSVTVNGTATDRSYFVVNQNTNFPIGKYALSGCAKGGSLNTYFMTGNGFYAVADTGNNNGRLEVLPSSSQTNVVIVISSGYTANNLVFKPQLEVGTAPTNYEPYIEPIEYAITADGTVEGVNSLYPTTTLYSDTTGVKIEAKYNRDANKVIADQQAQIDELKALILNMATN